MRRAVRGPAPRILLAPLTWGLGHAARCLPIAEALAARGADVHWASDGAALALLRTERPDDIHHELPGYGVRHASASAIANGLRQLPGMLAGIRRERRAVAALHRDHAYDLIVSDHRYGCRATGVPSVLVCHQVHLPLANPLVAVVPTAVHRALARRFDELAVPDWPPPRGLAGRMSRPLPGVPTRYLGPVSRFRKTDRPLRGGAPASSAPELAVVLSGPEPARSRAEALALLAVTDPALAHLDPGGVVLARGLPGEAIAAATADERLLAAARGLGLVIHDFLPAGPLGDVLADARALVVRPGYTTVMDLAALGRPAIYVPTPGQPEQAVLAKALAAAGRGVDLAERDLPRGLAGALSRLRSLPRERASGEAREPDRLAAWADDIVARCRSR